jgi:hypothetical protein
MSPLEVFIFLLLAATVSRDKRKGGPAMRNLPTRRLGLFSQFAFVILTFYAGLATPPSAHAQVKAYRTSNWSPWSRAAGVEYRYRWGWDPTDSRYSKQIDAIFEMKNLQRAVWEGAARSTDCNQNTVSMGTNVRLQPKQTRQVKFRTPNCGTLQSPEFRPNVVRAGRID